MRLQRHCGSQQRTTAGKPTPDADLSTLRPPRFTQKTYRGRCGHNGDEVGLEAFQPPPNVGARRSPCASCRCLSKSATTARPDLRGITAAADRRNWQWHSCWMPRAMQNWPCAITRFSNGVLSQDGNPSGASRPRRFARSGQPNNPAASRPMTHKRWFELAPAGQFRVSFYGSLRASRSSLGCKWENRESYSHSG